MTVSGIEAHSDHLETANMTGIKNDLCVMDRTDFNTGAGGGLRHGRRGDGGDGGGEGETRLHKYPRTLNPGVEKGYTRLRLALGYWGGRKI